MEIKEQRKAIEKVLMENLKFIDDDEHTYLGSPKKLINELLKELNQNPSPNK